MSAMDVYTRGDALYGDDFSSAQIEAWYRDEAEGYADLGARDRSSYSYVYHALNIQHGFRRLQKDSYNHVLGMGSAYGDEFLPIIRDIRRMTIVESSSAFLQTTIQGVPCEYVKASVEGTVPLPSESVDLITCLGVLHHIPNVSSVVRELYRCLCGGGEALIREPIVSMGDWSRPRPGLTKHERGIPIGVFRELLRKAGFTIRYETLCFFPLIPKVCRGLRISAYNSRLFTWLDAKLSSLFSHNTRYCRTTVLQKCGPTSVYFVLRK